MASACWTAADSRQGRGAVSFGWCADRWAWRVKWRLVTGSLALLAAGLAPAGASPIHYEPPTAVVETTSSCNPGSSGGICEGDCPPLNPSSSYTATAWSPTPAIQNSTTINGPIKVPVGSANSYVVAGTATDADTATYRTYNRTWHRTIGCDQASTDELTLTSTGTDADTMVLPSWAAQRGTLPSNNRGYSMVYTAPISSGTDVITVTFNDLPKDVPSGEHISGSRDDSPVTSSLSLTVYKLATMTSSDSAACIDSNVTFNATTDPLGGDALITWSASGAKTTTGTGSSFTTAWTSTGLKTVIAACGNAISKTIKIVQPVIKACLKDGRPNDVSSGLNASRNSLKVTLNGTDVDYERLKLVYSPTSGIPTSDSPVVELTVTFTPSCGEYSLTETNTVTVDIKDNVDNAMETKQETFQVTSTSGGGY